VKTPKLEEKKELRQVRMRDGRETGAAEPYTYTTNTRLNLERSLNSISMLIHALIDWGGKARDLDYRIAHGIAIALEELADETPNVWDGEEVRELGVTDFILKQKANR
jgi:hypothetical protein